MNTINSELFSEQWLIILIFAEGAAAICLLIEKIFGRKTPRFIKSFLQLILSLSASVIYDMAVVQKSFCITAQAIATGAAAGSLATALTALFRQIKNRGLACLKEPIDVEKLFIEGLLSGYVKQENKNAATNAVREFLRRKDNLSKETASSQLCEIIMVFADEITPVELAALVAAILKD